MYGKTLQTHLALIRGGTVDRPSAGGAPPIDAAIGSNMAEAAGMHLQHTVVRQQLDPHCGAGPQEAAVTHLLYSLPNAKHLKPGPPHRVNP
jgi:hypothetical protein